MDFDPLNRTPRSRDKSIKFAKGFDEWGPEFGAICLLHKGAAGFEVPSRDRLEKMLYDEFGEAYDVTRTIEGLAVVARALDAGNLALAAIATSLLQVPRPLIAVKDRPFFAKASPDDPIHPGWPVGTPNGRGGKFRPKDASVVLDPKMEAKRLARIERLNARRGVRSILRCVLTAKRLARFVLEAAAEAVPVLDVIDSAALMEDLAEVAAAIAEENVDIDAAKAFAEYGPHTLEELYVGTEEESFTSFDAFKKGDLDKRFGPAGDGYEYHHIVEQGTGTESFVQPQLQSTSNIVRIPKILHEEVSAIFQRIEDGADLSLRGMLRSSSFAERRAAGLQVLRQAGALYP